METTKAATIVSFSLSFKQWVAEALAVYHDEATVITVNPVALNCAIVLQV